MIVTYALGPLWNFKNCIFHVKTSILPKKKVNLELCFRLLDTLGKGVQMHGVGDAATVHVACCILPLLCHGLHCRGVSGSCLTESMGERALVNFSHLQTLAITKDDISKRYFFSSTSCLTLVQ